MANCARTLAFYCRDFTRGVPTVTSPGREEEEEIDMDMEEIDWDGPTAAEQLIAAIALEESTGMSATGPRSMEKLDPHPEAEPTPQDIVNGTRKRKLSEFDVGSWRPALPTTSTASTSNPEKPTDSEPSTSGAAPSGPKN